jgi:hypothetical protein
MCGPYTQSVPYVHRDAWGLRFRGDGDEEGMEVQSRAVGIGVRLGVGQGHRQE